jgi:sugar phosphate isomerase/epimerase
MSIHSRVSICEAGLDRSQGLEDHLAAFERIGVQRVGLASRWIEQCGWESGIELIRGSGFDVSYLIFNPLFALADPSRWEDQRRGAVATIDCAAALGVGSIYGVTGPAIGLSFDQATEAFAEAMEPVVQRARAAGIRLMIEATNPNWAFINFPHTFADAVTACRAAGIDICLDVHHVWTDPRLRADVEAAADILGLVQVADYTDGTSEPRRPPPGDGVIALEEIIGWTLEAGYDGIFDIELAPGNDEDAHRRAAEHLTTILERLGVDSSEKERA